ncbi:MAG: AAA family ATPase [Candidatus Margulisiibacteriota bacterium]
MNVIPNFIKRLKTSNFKLIETHIDYVLVGPKFTYKIKKNVKFDFVDYTSLAKRKHFCLEEIRLNRRYSSEIYLEVVPVKLSFDGKYAFGGKGKTIDYAVMMKTLPNERRLDILLAQNRVTPKMMEQIALAVLAFHSKAKTSRQIQAFGSWQHRIKVIDLNYYELDKFYKKIINKNIYCEGKSFLHNFVYEHKLIFKNRMQKGKIKDLHGDLHAGNIFYLNKPYIFDCIEFNQEFRYIDVAAEISFLLMELEFKGHKELAEVFLRTYLEQSKDWELLALLDFYKCHYAIVRAMVTAMEGKLGLTQKYLKLAGKYANPKPLLIAIGGMIGSGKSTLAKKIAAELGLSILQSDKIRKTLASIPFYSRPDKRALKELYSPDFTKRTYASLYDQAEKYLSANESVILDASFARIELRRPLISIAKKTKADFFFIESKAPEKVILKRLRIRQKEKRISDAGVSLYYSFKKQYQTPNELKKCANIINFTN